MLKKNNQILAIIPARGGSKGVPRKNIRLVGGSPLIYWSIKAAQNSKLIDHFFVSTDDVEIAEIASNFSAPVQMRPAQLAGDKTKIGEAIIWALKKIENEHNKEFSHILLLQPTAPLRNSFDIDDALKLLLESEADSLISVYKVDDSHPARMYKINRNRLIPFSEEYTKDLRQDLPDIYHRNGSLYACTRSCLIENENIWGGDIVSICNEEKSIYKY